MLSLRGKEGTIRRASFLYLSLVSVWGLVWAALTSGGRLTASSHMGAEPPCSFPHFPLPLLAWNLSLQLQLSVLFFNLFPVLSLFFKPFASLSIWKVSGMKESRTWRKTLWVLHFPHFQIKKDGGKEGTPPQSHWNLGVRARTKPRALCLSPVLCYVPVGEVLVSKGPVSGAALSLQKHRRGWKKKKSSPKGAINHRCPLT